MRLLRIRMVFSSHSRFRTLTGSPPGSFVRPGLLCLTLSPSILFLSSYLLSWPLNQNVVEFSRTSTADSTPVRSADSPNPTPAGSLIVSVEAVPNAAAAPVRRMDFVFRRTGVRWGATGGFDLPFAVGRGHFDVLHLDEALRVDRDANGWVNVYAYDGPATRCTVGG